MTTPAPATSAADVDGTHDEDAHDEDTAWDAMVARAAERIDYRLTYAVTDPRQAHPFGLYGPPIPNSYAPDEDSSGDWEDPDFVTVVSTEQEAVDRWFTTGVREAVHESLEWFKVDGERYLDPHGTHENAIHALCEKFAADLIALRTGSAAP